MNKYFTHSLIVIFSILSLFGAPVQQAQAAKQGDVISAEDLLRPDGTLDLTQNHHGAVDISNFDVELDPTRGPVFMPTGINETWNPLGSGLNGIVYAIAVVGTDIYVGGDFTDAGGVAAADYIAKWDGSTWSALGSGLNNTVLAIAARGADIYVGGGFTNAGRTYIAKWDGTNWSALGSGLNSWVYSIAVRGADVYAGGVFSDAGGVAAADYIARWNGGSWSALGAGLNNTVQSIAVSGANLYVGGRFTDAGGVATADYIARWNGSAWSALGSGVNNWVYSVAASETDVYIGGGFTDAGGVTTADYIAKWNGSTWSALGGGVNNWVYSIAVSGTDVYAGGVFSDVGGISTSDNIAKWNGSAWIPLSTGLNDSVFTIALLGNDLYAGGLFVNADGISNNNKIARYQFTGQTILVTTGADEITLNGQCSLREAITAAQSNQVVDSCVPGGGHNAIIFSDTVSTITLNDHLPIISDFYGLTIDGGGDVQISGNNLWHPFSVEKAGLGIGLSKPVLILANITIRGGHRASGSGGAITNDDGLVIIHNTNFTTNFSGVLENSPGGYVIISNSTFSFNGSPNGSGAINNIGTSSPAVVKIYNSTISANTSVSLGAVNNDSFMYIYNSIIASNNGTTIDCSENLTYGATYGTNNLIELDQCSFTNGYNGNIIGLEANLGSLNGSPAYFQLNPGSPAIDAGSNAICAAPPVNNLSQNGVSRPQGANCDIGSYEAPPPGISVTIGGTNQGTYTLSSGSSQVLKYAVDGGPVVIGSGGGPDIIASLNQWRRRPSTTVGWTGVSQSMGLPVSLITDTYYFPRYDDSAPSSLYNAMLLANVDTVSRDITVTIGGVVRGTYTLAPSASQFVSYPGVVGGPVVVSSDPGARIVASLYELIRDPSAAGWNGQSEMMGLPASQLSDEYLIPIYFGAANPNTLNASLHIANVSGGDTTVEIWIAGVLRGSYPLAANTGQVVKYALDGGPVEIRSNNGANIVASLNQWRRRPSTTVGWTGVSQSMALPVALITNEYVIPRYDDSAPSSLYNALLLANVDTVSRDITVTIGGVVRGTYTLAPSASQFVSYPGVVGGPVVVRSDPGAQIVASLYELIRDPSLPGWNGQSEMMGLPFSQLSDQYLIPLYFGAANPNTLNASIYIAVP